MFPAAVAVLGLIVVILFCFRIYITRTTECPTTLRLDGKTVIITGATSGIGQQVALECAWRGARVVLGCRNASKAGATSTYIRRKTANIDVHFIEVDLSSLTSVRAFFEDFTKQFDRVDVLINNAAYMGPRRTTVEGHDLCMQVNFLAAFYLSNLFVLRHVTHYTASGCPSASISNGINRMQHHPKLLRIVNVSSDSYSRGRLDLSDIMSRGRDRGIYDAYSDSKLAMMLFTAELNIRYSPVGVTCLAAHPGPVQTGLQSNWPGLGGIALRLLARALFRCARDGAQTVVYCAAVPDNEANGFLRGKLVVDCVGRDVEASVMTREICDAEKLWTIATALCGLTRYS